ncbi:MAG: hypothetical protein M1816_004090 [Peltula sp. TS41687]|nr:MAG: hypothetical protein M1816_004090 [Peltula sp. TS41687]
MHSIKLSSSLLLFSCLALAQPYESNGLVKRVITPDNTCGGTKGYTCNPNDPFGGSCCSASGYCGYTAAYCGAGCQKAYGSCFGPSPAATQSGNFWVVNGVGKFTTARTFDFAGQTTLPAGLYATSDTIRDTQQAGTGAKYDHVFQPALATVGGGYLQLKVPGGQATSPIRCAEVATTFSNILYASVRTTAILSNPAGTCNGMFFYKSDTQEMDIEFLSDANSFSNPRDGTRPMSYTNQDVNGNRADNTHATAPSPSDATSAAHEYRIDWTPGKTLYYLDGVLQKTFTTDVPTIAGSWLWNNWASNSNGDPGFTGSSPPSTDSIFKISKIVMYYNTTA